MVRCVHVCCGSEEEPHDPTEMRVDKNGVDIFWLPDDTLRLTEGRGWTSLASAVGANDFEGLKNRVYQLGGDYYGCGDRHICPVCGTAIVWRV